MMLIGKMCFDLLFQTVEMYAEEIDGLKEKVRCMLKSTTSSIAEKIILIDTLERVGVSYHFVNEIEEQLGQIFYSDLKIQKDEKFNFSIVALQFRILRQHGFSVSCGTFFRYNV